MLQNTFVYNSISVWICDRLAKEKISYEKESDTLAKKIEKMKEETPQDYNIKKQVIGT